MRTFLVCLLSVLVFSFGSAAGLSGTKTIPGDYNTLAEAINDLNSQGVDMGGVTISLLAGNSEVAPAGGYQLMTLTGSVNSPIILQGNGNTITASASHTPGSLNDAVFKIIGTDYLSIQGFIIQENSANSVTTAATNTMTEFGIGIFYVSQTDGAKNVTIENNTITLNRLYQNSFGIYSNVRHSASLVTTAADITNASGANDNTHIYGNSISNVNQGIVIVGSTTAAYMNTGIDVGGTSAATGNMISTYGLTGTFSSYVSVSTSIMGINLNNCLNSNVSYNAVSCPGLNTSGTVYGIYCQASGTLPTTGGPYTNSLKHNSLSVKSGYASGTIYGLSNTVGNSTIAFDVSYNDFNTMGHTTATASGTIYCFYSTGGANIQTIDYNTFTNLNLNTTGSVYLLNYNSSMPLAASTQSVTHNSISGNFTKTGSGGTVYCTYSNASSVAGSSKILAYNDFSGITLNGSTILYGYYEADGGSPVKSIHDNAFSNITAGTGGVYGLYFNYGSANIFSNIFSNISNSGTITAMNCGGSNAASQNIYSNTVSGLSSNSNSTVTGILSAASSTGAISNIYSNKVCNVSANQASAVVSGISITAGTTVNAYNNMLSDLRLPASSATNNLIGINVTGGTNIGLFYNTVYLSATSTGTNFGSSALYASTTPLLNLINNILVNNSIPNGTGITSAFRYSNNSLSNYANSSNANCYYAGYPEDATHAVFYNGTAAYNIAGFQSLVGPNRDNISFLELPNFISASSPCGDVHMNGGYLSLCSEGGLVITSPVFISTDFDGQTRSIAPDVGADEYYGPIIPPFFPPGQFAASTLNSQQISLSFNLNASNDSVCIIFNTTGMFTVPAGELPAVGSAFGGGTLLYRGVDSPVVHPGLIFGTQYYYKAYSFRGQMYSIGSSATSITEVQPPALFTATAVSSSQINLAYTLNTQADEVVIALNNANTFGSPANGIALAVNDALNGGGVIIYKGPAALFNNSGLNSSTTYYYKIWSVDEYNYYSSTGLTANATTLCGPVQFLPWEEGFEAVTIPALPVCWYKENGDWASASNFSSTYDADAHAGFQFLREAYSATNEFIWTPGFQLLPNHLYDFSFWWAGDNYSGWTGDVFFNSIQSSAGALQLGNSFVTPSTVTTKTYYQVHNRFTVPDTAVYYLAIRVNASSEPWYLSFDDLRMEEVLPECPAPIMIFTNNITDSSATINFQGLSFYFHSIEYGPPGFQIGTGTRIDHVTNPYLLTGLTSNTTYSYYVGSVCDPGPYGTNWVGPTTLTTLNAPEKELDLKCLIQGLYNGSGGLNKSQGDAGDEFTGTTADLVSVELHDSLTGALVYSMNNLNLSTTGLITATLPGTYNGSYYLYLKHRNSIVTATASPVSFAGTTISYDFTTSASQAYGDNLILMPGGYWAIYGGDVNQDGLIDASDMIVLDNLTSTFATGYLPADANGDGLIDAGDMIIVDNNTGNFVSAVLPGY